MDKINILYVEPENLVRDAISQLIDSMEGFHVSERVGDAASALTCLRSAKLDLVVLDIALPRESGIDFLLELQRTRLAIKSLVLSSVTSEDMITQALLAGAQGYAFKNGTVDEFRTALETVSRSNKKFLPTSVTHLNNVSNNRFALGDAAIKNDPLAALSAREREIFHLLATGLQNTAIAKKLFISPRTVETHRARIVRKLGLSTNGELIRYAIKHGLSMP